tara:strand:- start:347 stop:709 length:363 start_codon:yes stop_codon:yes gene_type:complete
MKLKDFKKLNENWDNWRRQEEGVEEKEPSRVPFTEEEESEETHEQVYKSMMDCAYAGLEFQSHISDEEAAAFFRKMADTAEQRGNFGAIVDELRAKMSGKEPEPEVKFGNPFAKEAGHRE